MNLTRTVKGGFAGKTRRWDDLAGGVIESSYS
jgi:hypothetical protein